MTVLNQADNVLLGAAQADRIYLGADLVWEPGGDGGWAAEVAADSPFVWWRFEETSGSTVADEVGSNDGTVVGANLNVDGPEATGSAVSFNGSTNYINVGTLPGFKWGGSNPMTIECLVKASAVTWNGMFFGAHKNSGSPTYLFQAYWNDRLRFTVTHPNATGTTNRKYSRTKTAATNIANNNWRHLAFVYTDASTALKIYLDGVDDTETPVVNNNTVSETEHLIDLYLAARNSGGTLNLPNAIVMDEFVIYDKALSAARILAHAEAAGVT